jgi:hypothetical protein
MVLQIFKKLKKIGVANMYLAAITPIGRPMTIHLSGVRGKGNIINPRWRPNYKTKGHLSPQSETHSYYLPPFRHP